MHVGIGVFVVDRKFLSPEQAKRFRLLIVVAVVALTVTACGDDSGGSEQQVVTSTLEPTLPLTEAVTTVGVSPLDVAPPVWSTGIDAGDGSPVDSVEWFPTDTETVYAAFETNEIEAGTEFSVSWLMNDVQVPGLNPTLVITSATPPGWIEIHLDRTSEEAWPEGMLTIELRVDGELVSSGSTELRDD